MNEAIRLVALHELLDQALPEAKATSFLFLVTQINSNNNNYNNVLCLSLFSLIFSERRIIKFPTPRSEPCEWPILAKGLKLLAT